MTFGQSIQRQLFSMAYFQFSGRASRSEFWWFVLFCFIMDFAYAFIALVPFIGVLLVGLIQIYLIIPQLAVLCRRLHDSGHSSMLIWLGFLFIAAGMFFMMVGGVFTVIFGSANSVGLASGFGTMAMIGFLLLAAAALFAIIVFVLTLMPSTEGQNKYGMPEAWQPVNGGAQNQASYGSYQQSSQGFGQARQPNGFGQPFGQPGQQQPQQGFGQQPFQTPGFGAPQQPAPGRGQNQLGSAGSQPQQGNPFLNQK
jgi:uncharacterized membrane protein YhaH (DUF805 family)